jgi:hypothetical protein
MDSAPGAFEAGTFPGWPDHCPRRTSAAETAVQRVNLLGLPGNVTRASASVLGSCHHGSVRKDGFSVLKQSSVVNGSSNGTGYCSMAGSPASPLFRRLGSAS